MILGGILGGFEVFGDFEVFEVFLGCKLVVLVVLEKHWIMVKGIISSVE